MSDSFDLSPFQDATTIQRVLHNAKNVAVVGLSGNELRASYFVGFYLKRHGYKVFPVNPKADEILGEPSYKSLSELPEPVDIVNVFRAPKALPGIAEEAVSIGAKNLWCQFTVINEEGGAHRHRRRDVGRDGPLYQGRARTLRGPHALARVQHAPRDRRSRRAPVAWGSRRSLSP